MSSPADTPTAAAWHQTISGCIIDGSNNNNGSGQPFKVPIIPASEDYDDSTKRSVDTSQSQNSPNDNADPIFLIMNRDRRSGAYGGPCPKDVERPASPSAPAISLSGDEADKTIRIDGTLCISGGTVTVELNTEAKAHMRELIQALEAMCTSRSSGTYGGVYDSRNDVGEPSETTGRSITPGEPDFADTAEWRASGRVPPSMCPYSAVTQKSLDVDHREASQAASSSTDTATPDGHDHSSRTKTATPDGDDHASGTVRAEGMDDNEDCIVVDEPGVLRIHNEKPQGGGEWKRDGLCWTDGSNRFGLF